MSDFEVHPVGTAKKLAGLAAQVEDARVIELARQHLDRGLNFSRTDHITRATDRELVAFARALLAEGKG